MSNPKHKRKQQRAQKQADGDYPKPPGLNAKENSKCEISARAAGEKKTDHKEEYPMRLGERIKRSTLTDWLIALFTGVLAAASIYQFSIMSGQLDVMKQESRNAADRFHAELRPYVQGEDIALSSALVSDAPPDLGVRFSNTGKTPALNATPAIWVATSPSAVFPNASVLDTPQERGSIGTIPAGGSYLAHHNAGVLGPMSQKEINDIKAGKLWLYAYGSVRYRDAICSAEHIDVYCGRYNPNTGNFQICSYNQQPKKAN